MTQVRFDFDVLIVGGGPCGSTAAATARQHGLRTLVVEKNAFPRFHIGESLLPAGNAVLRATGVWPKIEAGGFMPKFGAEFHRHDGSECKKVVFANGLVPGLDRTFQVDRAQFDLVLLEHARALGAVVRQPAIVRSIESIAGGHRATLAGDNGEESVTASFVIDSTGRETALMTPQKSAMDESTFPKRIAIYSHFTGVKRAEGAAGGNILIVRLPEGWFWFIPLDAERTSVGVVAPVTAFRGAKLSPEAFFWQAVAESGKAGELLAAAAETMPFHVTSDYSYFRRNLAGERLLLAGDAAGFFDPIFSSGVYMATSSGRAAALLVAQAHARGGALSGAEQRRYTRAVKRRAAVFQKLITAFYDDDAFDVFMCQQVPWDLSRGLTSIVAGCADLTWPLWWRYQIFLAVCRIQKRFKLVRPSEPIEAVPAPLSERRR